MPETQLWEQLRLGNLDSVKVIAASLPDSSGAELFCRGLFESDGVKACPYYERVQASFPKSSAAPYALDRLKLYHLAREPKKASQYDRALKERFPNFRLPDYGWPGDTQITQVVQAEPPKEKVVITPDVQQIAGQAWSIQVGAFKNRKSAEATGRQVTRFGKVNYLERLVEGKKLIAVQVGRYPSKYEAEQTASQIVGSTGLQTTIVRASP